MLTATDVLDTVWAHAAGSLDREVGGVLLGTFDGDTAAVRVALPALKADGHRTHVTFTHEVWEDIHSTLDRDYPDLKIVGWYHSHPGFGVFLSEYDRFIQRNFFAGAAQVALVVDPHAGTLGWFGWRNEDIVLQEEAGPFPEHARRPGAAAGEADQRPAATVQARARTAKLAAVGVGVVGLVAGYLIGSGTAPVTDPEIAAAAQQLQRVEQQLEAAEAALVATLAAQRSAEEAATAADVRAGRAEEDLAAVNRQPEAPEAPPEPGSQAARVEIIVPVRILRGDTLSAVAARMYGDGSRIQPLLDANPWLASEPDELLIGWIVRVPVEVGR